MLIVPPQTRLPADFSTGMLSPVSSDSSTTVWPESTTPSRPTCSPGRTRTTSPTWTSESCTVFSTPSRSRRTVLGAMRMSLATASLVLPRVLASSQRPKVTSTTSPETASHCVWRAAAGKVSGNITT